MKFKDVCQRLSRIGFPVYPQKVFFGTKHYQERGIFPQKRISAKEFCPLCGKTGRVKRDPETGKCAVEAACAARRAQLDDATIKFLGLIPRKKDEKRPRKAPERR